MPQAQDEGRVTLIEGAPPAGRVHHIGPGEVVISGAGGAS
jgi:hypothetical protein